MGKTKYSILVVLLDVFIIMLIIGAFVLCDFYMDYKCSTTTDIRWFAEHNCLKYMDD